MRSLQPATLSSLHIIFTTSSGHTEHVVDAFLAILGKRLPKLAIEKQRAETAKPEDLLRGDIVVLACGTWNTGGTEGQLHPHMNAFLRERAKDVALSKKPFALIALGDDRYYYTSRAVEHLMQFVLQHDGSVCMDSLIVVNEPYGQEERVEKWAEKFLSKVPLLSA